MKKAKIIVLSLIALMILSVVAISQGSVSITCSEIKDIFLSQGDKIKTSIIVNIRLPRVVLAILVGANLSVAGALLQSVMKNPLADPGLIGVSSGASLMAIGIMLLFPKYTSLVPLAAFLGGICATFLIYVLAWQDGIKPMRIILSGVAINAMLGGATSLISILNSDKIQGVLMWLNGSLSGRSWNDVRLILPYSLVGLTLSLFCMRGANLLLLGDEKAVNLGLNVNRTRILLSVLAAFLAGISTSIVGVIGFIGLIVPHICRIIIGSDYKYLLPFSMIGGSLMLILADTFARTIASPVELPVGTLMAVIGGPFFLYLLRKGES